MTLLLLLVDSMQHGGLYNNLLIHQKLCMLKHHRITLGHSNMLRTLYALRCHPHCIPLPLQINPVTVVGLYEEAAVPQGKYLLVTAAGSSLARMLIRYAKSQGTKVIGTVRRKEQVQEIKDLG